jgi:hypothetical protein
LDGYVDIEDDFFNNKFNPFLACRERSQFGLRSSKIIEETSTFCKEKLGEIKKIASKLRLARYDEQIIRTLTSNLEYNVNRVLTEGASCKPPTISLNMLLPFSVLLLKAFVTNGETDGDMYDCCVYCCCEDEDPCVGVCPEPFTSTTEPLLDRAVRVVTEGGAAAVVGAGAGIVGGKLLSRRGSKPDEDMVYEDDELVEPDNVRIVEIPDKLPEVPELDRDKIVDSTVDPGYMDNTLQDLGGKPPGKKTDLPPDIGQPDYPEDIDNGVARGGMGPGDVLDWLMKDRDKREARIPTTGPYAPDPNKSGDDGPSIWQRAHDWLTKPRDDYYNKTPEEHKASDKAMSDGGTRAKDHGAWGGKSKLGETLTSGDPKARLEQALRDRKGKAAITAWRAVRAITKMISPGETKTFVPKTRVPQIKNLGLDALKATEQAKKIGQGTTVVRDWSGVADGLTDGVSQTGDTPYHKLISPDSTVIMQDTGIWQVDLAQQEAILKFEAKYDRTPDPSKPMEVEVWNNMVRDIVEAR